MFSLPSLLWLRFTTRGRILFLHCIHAHILTYGRLFVLDMHTTRHWNFHIHTAVVRWVQISECVHAKIINEFIFYLDAETCLFSFFFRWTHFQECREMSAVSEGVLTLRECPSKLSSCLDQTESLKQMLLKECNEPEIDWTVSTACNDSMRNYWSKPEITVQMHIVYRATVQS